jgi:hypothetical protein
MDAITAIVVETGGRGMNTLPLSLQIAGVVGGIIGTVLGVINLGLRIRENQPRLSVTTELEPTREDDETKYRLVVTVRNRSQAPVLVDRLYFEGPHPTQGMSEIQVPETYGGREIPFWLERRDRERFQVMTQFMLHRMGMKGFEGTLRVTATVIDGGGNRYRSKPFKIDMTDSKIDMTDSPQQG